MSRHLNFGWTFPGFGWTSSVHPPLKVHCIEWVCQGKCACTNLTIIQHKGLGLVLVFFTSQSIVSGDPGGSLGSKESFNNKVGVV